MMFFSLIATSISAQQQNETTPPQKPEYPQSLPQIPPPPPPPVAEPPDIPPPPPLLIPGLTDEQTEKIRKADLKQLEAMTPLKSLMREKNAHMNTILTAMPFNNREADKVADEIGAIHTSVLKLQIRHDQEIRAILNPDQQIIFDSKPKPFLGRGKMGRERP